MNSRSGGSGNKKRKSYSGAATSDNHPSPVVPSGKDSMRAETGEEGLIPLESRMIEIRDENGVVKYAPALDKRWAPHVEFVEFYLPSCELLFQDESVLNTWQDQMEIYIKDLKWLLTLPHHQFWSVMVHSPAVSHQVLRSFLNRAPQFIDKEFQIYLQHDVICTKYQDIYSLVFRVFLRLCTFKESKKDFITPVTWVSLLVDHQIIDVLKLLDLCVLYESEKNELLPKMIDNVMKHCPKLVNRFKNIIPVILSKSKEMTDNLRRLITESSATRDWNLADYNEVLSFFLSTTCGLYKFIKVYTPAAEIVMKFPNSLTKLAMTYEPDCCALWTQVIAHLPDLQDRVNLLRILLIRLFRMALAKPTIDKVTSSNDQRIDEYFQVITNCLDEKTFIRDYEKAYPFRGDIKHLLSRGVFIDEMRIDYIANAISSCFNACGEDYAVEKIVVDPLYDPNFDRQLLGACSLDVTGIELQSLVTQVKDILPELPDAYVEVVLKHYSYKPETAINALLEGSVPTRLEKYKNENYVKNSVNSSNAAVSIEQKAEDTELEKLTQSRLVIKDAGAEAEKFYAGKRRYGFEDDCRGTITMDKDLNPKTKQLFSKMQEEAASGTAQEEVASRGGRVKKSVRIGSATMEQDRPRYIDESLLPSIRNVEYDDEYDDTYDGYSVGMTEPDNTEVKPLNQKKMQAINAADDEDSDEDSEKNAKKLLDFCEDPAIVRARMERQREEKSQKQNHHRRYNNGPPPSNDVVGKAKGQGQDKDVVYARRQKTVNKDQGGFKKKKADFKRREF